MTDAAFKFLPLGAIIQSFKVKDTNIVLGFPEQEHYVKYNTAYFGETIGRIANRIKDARIDSLNGGKSYALAANDGPNHLHGGNEGWGKRIWKGPTPVGTRQIPSVDGLRGGESVEFTLRSEDGDEGYPGTVEAKVVYTAGNQVVDGKKEALVLGIEYEARLVGGADETVINLTNHSYFNLTGDDNIAGTTVTLATNNHLPAEDDSIPLGNPVPFPGLDTSKPFVLGPEEPKFDRCFTTTTDPSSVPIDTRSQSLALNLSAFHPKSGIHLEVLSTEPSFQFYTGDLTNVPAAEGLPARGARSAFCCEPGRWINACNVPEWRNMVLLKKGETYGARIVYRAWTE
ncbi:aldose-1-epimerase [Trichoderma parareesei]|uniref:Aldose-1-epimerase n=1 Tax=Trichoderma parareesei TaxID=858221 RepID=A0A2H2YXI3_TRIPA|nr:aldose-1-epimerase [Trichoderma parareesei]